MLIRVNEQELLEEPTAEEIVDILRRLDAGEIQSLMLERRAGWFLRVETDPRGEFGMVTTDGLPRLHYQTKTGAVSLDQVSEAVASYVAGREDWRHGIAWELIEPQTYRGWLHTLLGFLGLGTR
jgi:hypothetical protein